MTSRYWPSNAGPSKLLKRVVGCAIWFLAGIIYFAIHARHYIVLSPEEEFAMNQRERPKETAV